MGERLKALVWARAFANHYGARFGFSWEHRFKGQAHFHSIETAEQMFAPDFLAAYGADARPHGPVQAIETLLEGGFPSRSSAPQGPATVIVAQNYSRANRQRIRKGLTPDAFPEAFSQIGFSDTIQAAMARAEGIDLGAKAVGLHLRAGDIVYGWFRFCNNFTPKVIPYQLASDHVAKRRRQGRQVLIFGQDEALGRGLAEAHGAIWVPDILPGDFTIPAASAMFEIRLLSRCSEIVAAESGFAQIAALIGRQDIFSPRHHYSPAETLRLILADPAPPRLAAGVSDLQNAFSLWVAAGLLIDGGEEERLRAIDCLEAACRLDPPNGFYRFVRAALLYERGQVEAGEGEIARIPAGPNAGALAYLLNSGQKPMGPYISRMRPAMVAGHPWASLCFAFFHKEPPEVQAACARIALRELSLEPKIRTRLEAISAPAP